MFSDSNTALLRKLGSGLGLLLDCESLNEVGELADMFNKPSRVMAGHEDDMTEHEVAR